MQVALIYQPDDIVGFATAFYGCLFAGITPVAVAPPKTRDVRTKLKSYDLLFFKRFTKP